MSEIIRHQQDMLDLLAADSVEQAKRNVYKYNDCGPWIEFYSDGIRIGSIVEGCDFGTAIYPLKYPFTDADYNARMAAVEEEASALWDWANEGPPDTGMTWADIGQDAPDVDRDFLHLNPKGRSS
jgi:hypothetical protein